MLRKTRPLHPDTPVHAAVPVEGRRNPNNAAPKSQSPYASKPHSIPIGGASAAPAASFKRLNRKCPGLKLSAVYEANAPGHFRLSHSV
jgi:hypothetical protein